MTVEVKEFHPAITPAVQADWQLMADAIRGDGAVKAQGETYLPKPSGFKSQPDNGRDAYATYRMRAQLPEIVAPTIGGMVGVVHGQEITVEIPAALEYLQENATGGARGLPLEQFHKRITRGLLGPGRVGVLAEAPEGGGEPYLAIYSGAAIINWDEDFYVLDESLWRRDGFVWKWVPRWRVLDLDGGTYRQRVYEGDDPQLVEEVQPNRRGGGLLDFVPFTVSSALDVEAEVRTPPLIGVAQAARAIYQLSADYRWQLYMSGQETLVAINGAAPQYVGAGAVHSMFGSGEAASTPDLKYVSPSCSGIEAHKAAMDHHREQAIMAGARMFQDSDRPQESGEARRLRFAAETANLMSVALASCAVLERSLRHAAQMVGASESEVVITPPADLMDRTMEPADAEALVRVWQAGAIGYETLYENLQRGGIASPERTAEEELGAVDDDEFREPATPDQP